MKTTIIMTAVAAAALSIAYPSAAADLRPDQKQAVEKMLAQLEPSMREPMRAQIEQSVALLNKEQVAMLVASMEESDSGAQEMTDEIIEEEPTASPEDLAYNRQQYEPVIRANWQAQKSFDNFVDAELAAKCPSRDRYAVYGSGYRYELRQLAPNWPRASNNVDADVAILSGSYAPQDGRYQFDFSKVRTSYDKQAVSAAVAKACAEWSKEAAAFQAKAKPLQAAEDFDGLFALERSAQGKVEPIESTLNEVLNVQAPAADYALYTALQNGRRVN